LGVVEALPDCPGTGHFFAGLLSRLDAANTLLPVVVEEAVVPAGGHTLAGLFPRDPLFALTDEACVGLVGSGLLSRLSNGLKLDLAWLLAGGAGWEEALFSTVFGAAVSAF
jgi:hypothetical protein